MTPAETICFSPGIEYEPSCSKGGSEHPGDKQDLSTSLSSLSFQAHETDNNAVHESKLCEVPNTMEQGKGIRSEGDMCSVMWGQGRPSQGHREGLRAGDQ